MIPDYEPDFAAAIRSFWEVRNRQADDQRARGVADAGTRGAVTGGKHLDALSALIRQVFHDAGITPDSGSTILPGYYRIAKNHDVVVFYKGQVVAVIELKSHVGSFGNNQNNRVEEMIGQSRDLWVAAREKLLGEIRPWFGYVMVAQDHPGSRALPGGRKPRLPTDPRFTNTSYLDRYQIALDRLRLEGDMNAVCLVYSNEDSKAVEYPDQTMTFTAFAAAIHGRVTEIVGMLG